MVSAVIVVPPDARRPCVTAPKPAVDPVRNRASEDQGFGMSTTDRYEIKTLDRRGQRSTPSAETIRISILPLRLPSASASGDQACPDGTGGRRHLRLSGLPESVRRGLKPCRLPPGVLRANVATSARGVIAANGNRKCKIMAGVHLAGHLDRLDNLDVHILGVEAHGDLSQTSRSRIPPRRRLFWRLSRPHDQDAIPCDIKHLPDSKSVMELQLAIEKLAGRLGRIEENQLGMSRTVLQVQELLMKGAGSRTSTNSQDVRLVIL